MTTKTIKNIFTGFFLGGVLAATQTNALAQEVGVISQKTKIHLKIKGYVFGIKIMNTDFQSAIKGNIYSVRADMRTSGLAALLKKIQIWSTTTGYIVGNDLQPFSHIQQNLNKKHRRVEMNYKKDGVDISINPPLGSLGTPKPTKAEKFNSDDTLSALMNIMMQGRVTSKTPCEGIIPVFDSKQHYNLRLERAGNKHVKQKGFNGEAIICKAYYIPVSGYDPEDLPSQEEQETPLVIYLANFKEDGLYIPVKITYKISGFKAVLKTRSIKITH
ncbi:MAG: DUF3108 domain-containing protein [Robiginitomaculum sp.]